MKRLITLVTTLLMCVTFGCSSSRMKQTLGTFDNKSLYKQEVQTELEKARSLLKEIENQSGEITETTLLDPINELDIIIERTASKASLLYYTHPDKEIRKIAEDCEQDISILITEISLSRPIYESLAHVDISGSSADTQRFTKQLLRDYRRSGVDKPEETRNKIKTLREELVKLSQEFAKNMISDVRSIKLDSAKELSGLPKDYIETHKPGEDGKITITTDYPDYIPFSKYASNDKRRMEIYKEFRNRGYPKNNLVLKNILIKRYELAKLLGYKNFAEYIIETKMAKNTPTVENFIDKISGTAKPRSDKDYEILLNRLKEIDPKSKKVADWQKTYLVELIKREDYKTDSRVIRQYFQTKNVLDGIFNLVSEMYGVTIKPWKTPVWHKSVKAYEMIDGGKVTGRFFLDLYPRENKYKHAAHFGLLSGIKNRQVPVSALVCNFPGQGDESALMEHAQVTTFFHEFGHMLHQLFGGNQRWLYFSGIATELDFLEAPSQMFEEWAWNTDTLKRFATNKQGEMIPDDLVNKMVAAKDFGIGLHIKHQMFYAALSLNYYNCNPKDLDLQQTFKKLQNKYSPYNYVENTHMYANFGHLDGYSAMYYSYMWAEVISKDLFSRFKKEGLLNQNTAKQYRKTILEPGGSKDAVDLIEGFLGRPYSFAAFADWLKK